MECHHVQRQVADVTKAVQAHSPWPSAAACAHMERRSTNSDKKPVGVNNNPRSKWCALWFVAKLEQGSDHSWYSSMIPCNAPGDVSFMRRAPVSEFFCTVNLWGPRPLENGEVQLHVEPPFMFYTPWLGQRSLQLTWLLAGPRSGSRFPTPNTSQEASNNFIQFSSELSSP